MRKQEIPFKEVRNGETFASYRSKRAFSGVKISLHLCLPAQGGSQAYNAVMVEYDHLPDIGPESGTLVFVNPEEVVEVWRRH